MAFLAANSHGTGSQFAEPFSLNPIGLNGQTYSETLAAKLRGVGLYQTMIAGGGLETWPGYHQLTLSTSSTVRYYFHGHYRPTTINIPTTGYAEIMQLVFGSDKLTLRLYNDKHTEWWRNSVQIGGSGNPWILDKWHSVWLQVITEIGVGDNKEWMYCWIDGRLEFTELVNWTSNTVTEFNVGRINAMASGESFDADYADLAVFDNSDGQERPEGACHVAYLKPIGDSANDGWQQGSGGGGNKYPSVAQVPPIGSVGGVGDTKQIRNNTAGSASTDAYDATMESYATGGMAGGDKLLGVMGSAIHAEDTGSGAKDGGLIIVSNPAEGSENAFVFGNDQGAEGAYPSNWAKAGTTLFHTPAVTRTTSPVLRVRKTSSGTAKVFVCQMILLAAFEAGPVRPKPCVGASEAAQRASRW